MRKRWIALAALLFLAACSKEAKPEERLQEYVTAWNKQDFAGMYSMLAKETKQKISKEEFVQRYEKIYHDIEVKQLHVKAEKASDSKDEKAEAVRRYQLDMETIAGPVSFRQDVHLVKEKVKDEDTWNVEWDASHIFPAMKEGDRLGIDTYEAKRGEILDRNGNGLAVNGKAPQAGIVPAKLGADAEGTKASLAKLLQVSVAEINSKLEAKWVKPDLFVPIAFLPGGADEQAYLALPGVGIRNVAVRDYPLGEAAAHAVGYIREVSAEDLGKLKEKGYQTGDVVGKAGLEQVYEAKLRGQDGARLYIIGADKQEKGQIAKRDARDGQTIAVTLDSKLQQEIYAQLGGEAGAATALQPQTGELLALVSSPSYNPNSFVRGLRPEQWQAWNENPQKPLLNRFTKAYTPGSVFKPVTAAIGMQAGIVKPDENKAITGLKWAQDASWGDYYVTRVKEASPVNLEQALLYSDNIYFAQQALAIGADKFEEGAKAFGFGEKLPISYPFQQSQLGALKKDIALADTGYGQGEVLMTPLHVALTYAPIVNSGKIPAPVLVKGEEQPKVWKEGAMTTEEANLLKRALTAVVNDPEGTGRAAQLPGRLLAGKTGTAELKQEKAEAGKENGWFVGFDAASPNLIVAMMVEDVKEKGGSSHVAEKVRRLFAIK
ncbi:penicillin-binding transpeptidase domain-containing protein [Ectobacillus ponti]|uniref:serine-type D-Ala-D-Ala carboxypeptidase n=1 Tax=Ectobacillus ponti TaxID=2961894 RepID=A0AA42BTB9_9BACI|nr:penicillin-binding transpeptidase domain-containing protein [Ectobacillus ponti]MCP8969313.1 penicillin-binding transpeptidase domain-containing protein [Ectobacillus ponti]